MINVQQQSPCVRLQEISTYVSGRLSSIAADDLETHISDCEECATELENALAKTPQPQWFSTIRYLASREPDANSLEVARHDVTLNHASELARFPNRSSQYTRIHLLGSGGMGVVWKGWDNLTRRSVAIKQLKSGNTDLRGVQRLLREARALARLSHPNIVSIFDVITEAASPLLVMEYVDGMTLSAWQMGQPVSSTEAAELTAVIASALQHAHSHGVIHRDLKPSNVLLPTQEPRSLPRDGSGQLQLKITDFGIAGMVGDSTFTLSGQPLGTPTCMAPEQINGTAIDSPTIDVYACGVLLYELLTGRPPFIASDPAVVLMLIQSREPAAPRILQPHLPRDIETICLKCLSRRPQERYASASALAADLQHFLAGRPIQARPVSAVTRVIRWSARNRTLAALLISTLMSLVIATVVSLTALHHQKRVMKLVEESRTYAVATARQERELRSRAEVAEKVANQKAASESSLRTRHLALLLKMIRAADSKNTRTIDTNALSLEVLHDFVVSLNEPTPPLSWLELELVVRYLSLKQFSMDTTGLANALTRVDQALDAHETNPQDPGEFVEFLRIRQQFFEVSDDIAENMAMNCRRWLRVAESFLRQAEHSTPLSPNTEKLLAARTTALQEAYSAGMAVRQVPWAPQKLANDLLQQVENALAHPPLVTQQPRNTEKLLLETVRQQLTQQNP